MFAMISLKPEVLKIHSDASLTFSFLKFIDHVGPDQNHEILFGFSSIIYGSLE